MYLLILGAGKYGSVAKEIAEAMGVYHKIDFLDDQSELAVGKLNDIEKLEYDEAFVAIGDSATRHKWTGKIKKLATLIHPNATVMPSALVGEGSIIEAGVVISSNAKVGKGCIVMSNAVVGHDAVIGDYCQLKYNCTICERCVVSNQTKIDSNVVLCKND